MAYFDAVYFDPVYFDALTIGPYTGAAWDFVLTVEPGHWSARSQKAWAATARAAPWGSRITNKAWHVETQPREWTALGRKDES